MLLALAMDENNNMNDEINLRIEEPLLNLTLYRVCEDDQGTLGVLFHKGTFICWIMELPWRNNDQYISCITPGTYDGFYNNDNELYCIRSVPGRFAIQFHGGNWAGDESLGFISDSAGCLLPGMKPAWIMNQRAVASSKKALNVMDKYINHRDFKLTIVNV